MANRSEITSSRILYHQVASLLLYKSIFDDEVGQAFLDLLNNLHHGENSLQKYPVTAVDCLRAYGHWFNTLANRNESWQDYLINRILSNDNPFSRQVQRQSLKHLPLSIIAAAKHDLKVLHNLYYCSSKKITEWVQTASQTSVELVTWSLEISSDNFLVNPKNWEDCLEELASYYCQQGTGIFAEYKALRWQKKQLIGITYPDPILLSEIVGYDYPKEALIKNTEFLLAGYSSLNVLLYGSRGTGKSSLVKALLNEYSGQGLRLIEVSKLELQDLPIIIDNLRDLPQKFILFVDDLSFEEDNDTFKSLKVVLEGSLTAKARNIVVYATSNRRHLVREFFSERPHPSEGEEIHNWDTVQEKLSFSDRFGLTLTFEPANQEIYLKIVHHLAQQAGINLPSEELEFRAKQWATRHNGRSGRTARQFIDFLQSELAFMPPHVYDDK